MVWFGLNVQTPVCRGRICFLSPVCRGSLVFWELDPKYGANPKENGAIEFFFIHGVNRDLESYTAAKILSFSIHARVYSSNIFAKRFDFVKRTAITCRID